jgi:hypothetical protein
MNTMNPRPNLLYTDVCARSQDSGTHVSGDQQRRIGGLCGAVPDLSTMKGDDPNEE